MKWRVKLSKATDPTQWNTLGIGWIELQGTSIIINLDPDTSQTGTLNYRIDFKSQVDKLSTSGASNSNSPEFAEAADKYASEVFTSIVSLLEINDPVLISYIFTQPVLLIRVIGCLEYDPQFKVVTQHREFLKSGIRFVEVIPFNSPGVLALVHENYILQYLLDVVLINYLSDACMNSLNLRIRKNYTIILHHITSVPNKTHKTMMETLLDTIHTFAQEHVEKVNGITLDVYMGYFKELCEVWTLCQQPTQTPQLGTDIAGDTAVLVKLIRTRNCLADLELILRHLHVGQKNVKDLNKGMRIQMMDIILRLLSRASTSRSLLSPAQAATSIHTSFIDLFFTHFIKVITDPILILQTHIDKTDLLHQIKARRSQRKRIQSLISNGTTFQHFLLKSIDKASITVPMLICPMIDNCECCKTDCTLYTSYSSFSVLFTCVRELLIVFPDETLNFFTHTLFLQRSILLLFSKATRLRSPSAAIYILEILRSVIDVALSKPILEGTELLSSLIKDTTSQPTPLPNLLFVLCLYLSDSITGKDGEVHVSNEMLFRDNLYISCALNNLGSILPQQKSSQEEQQETHHLPALSKAIAESHTPFYSNSASHFITQWLIDPILSCHKHSKLFSSLGVSGSTSNKSKDSVDRTEDSNSIFYPTAEDVNGVITNLCRYDLVQRVIVELAENSASSQYDLNKVMEIITTKTAESIDNSSRNMSIHSIRQLDYPFTEGAFSSPHMAVQESDNEDFDEMDEEEDEDEVIEDNAKSQIAQKLPTLIDLQQGLIPESFDIPSDNQLPPQIDATPISETPPSASLNNSYDPSTFDSSHVDVIGQETPRSTAQIVHAPIKQSTSLVSFNSSFGSFTFINHEDANLSSPSLATMVMKKKGRQGSRLRKRRAKTGSLSDMKQIQRKMHHISPLLASTSPSTDLLPESVQLSSSRSQSKLFLKNPSIGSQHSLQPSLSSSILPVVTRANFVNDLTISEIGSVGGITTSPTAASQSPNVARSSDSLDSRSFSYASSPGTGTFEMSPSMSTTLKGSPQSWSSQPHDVHLTRSQSMALTGFGPLSVHTPSQTTAHSYSTLYPDPPPLTQKHSPLTQKHSPLTQKHSPLTQKHSPLTQKHSPLTQKHSPLTQKHSPLTQKHSPLTQKHSPLTQKHSPLTQKHSPLTQKHSPLTQKHSPLTQKHSPLTQKHSPLTQKHSPLTQKHSPLTQKHSPLTQKHSPLTQKHSPLTQKHSPLTQKHSPLTQKHSPLTQKHSPLTQKHSPLTQKHSPLTQKHSPLTQKHSPSTTPKQLLTSFMTTNESSSPTSSWSPGNSPTQQSRVSQPSNHPLSNPQHPSLVRSVSFFESSLNRSNAPNSPSIVRFVPTLTRKSSFCDPPRCVDARPTKIESGLTTSSFLAEIDIDSDQDHVESTEDVDSSSDSSSLIEHFSSSSSLSSSDSLDADESSTDEDDIDKAPNSPSLPTIYPNQYLPDILSAPKPL
ncbi:putative intraflagellar transport protein 74 like protein [Blattamonas nauphoetae]|uniref:Intraflagellar transport protein 74 like protein n=1 Tax=Blattamonas nauphoetae TaxID=2049346 RepID=A0ABQ9XXB3_9EUKA|nr:putative intraflagellar transport protein 74 like protein [Blattamonas nauphoetae]